MEIPTNQILCGDCLEFMRSLPDNCIDLITGSPPYESARRYDELNFSLQGQAWVDWMVPQIIEAVRICKGLVAVVVEGRTKNFRWSATPALLMADLHRAGIKLRKPPIYHRVGISGSGGPDWWRNDCEFVICASKGRLPWSNNLATGKPPKYNRGGRFSHHTQNGRLKDGKEYPQLETANPGNVIHHPDFISGSVGKGHMGSDLAHETAAAFPEWLVKPFILSFCPPSGICYDPWCGSGTTLAVAARHGRCYLGTDIRESQVELSQRRIAEVQSGLVAWYETEI